MTQYQEKIVGKPGGLVEPGVKQYGFLKKAFKKIKKGAKKVFKSPLGKIGLGALALGVPWGAGGTGGIGGLFGSKSAWGRGLGMLRNRGILSGAQGAGKYLASGAAGGQRLPPTLLSRAKKGIGDFGWGKAAFLGAGAGLTALPFLGGDDPEEEIIDDWPGVGALRKQAQDYYKAAPDYVNSPFMPPKEYVMSGYYGSKDGGIVGLANGGNPAEAQAEQMLRMEYQKYRNQGGTMSYQQFKMAVLQQAQGQGPMAQGQQAPMAQPQMAAYGGRMGYQGGELVEDASMVEETPTGMMEENVEEVQGEPTREQLEALAMEIFQLRLEELDEEQLMVVYQAAMEQQPEAMAMQEEDIQFNPQMAQPQMAAEGGLMSLGGMEKDYRQEGGFVPIGGKEKADDVPARLSKNEFVFTADAVRNAGGGDIDAGAEVMENVMNNLESGGQISEESQGGGGEEMISEEEIAEGPDGAQEMYDQQQMLQSRMA
jgi:hypothetical protein